MERQFVRLRWEHREHWEHNDYVTVATLDRPPVNAIPAQVREELAEVFWGC